MHIQTHVMSGWCISNYLDLTKRERFFCIIAASCPDLDGISYLFGQDAYWDYHHIIGHNALLCLLGALILTFFSSNYLKAFVIYIALFHLHLLMDYLGSGPGWGIAYYWPFSSSMLERENSWEFYSWQNICTGGLFFLWTLFIVVQKKRTPLEFLMPSLDKQLVAIVQKIKLRIHFKC